MEHGIVLTTWSSKSSKSIAGVCCGPQAAEQIVVLNGGRIAETGTHTELTQRGGQYAKLVSTQSLSLSNV